MLYFKFYLQFSFFGSQSKLFNQYENFKPKQFFLRLVLVLFLGMSFKVGVWLYYLVLHLDFH